MLYSILKIISKIYFKIFYNLKVFGYENLNIATNFIVSPNHTHWLDIPLIGSILPKKMYSFAKKELFENKLTSLILRSLGGFPVDRGAVSKTSIENAIEALKKGPLLLFPEGTRSRTGELLKGKRGAIYIATVAKVPIIPVGIVGLGRKFIHVKRTKLAVYIGKPFYPYEVFDPNEKDYYEKATNYLMEQIKECIEKLEHLP